MDIGDIYSTIQSYLNEPPLVIWGSGATISFGLPSMSKLKDEIENYFLRLTSPVLIWKQSLGKTNTSLYSRKSER